MEASEQLPGETSQADGKPPPMQGKGPSTRPCRPHERCENAHTSSWHRWWRRLAGFFEICGPGQKTCFEAALLEQTWIGGPIAAARSAGTAHSEFELQPGHSGHV